VNDKECLEGFFLNRDKVINRYEKGEINKTEYVYACMNFFKEHNLEAYSKIETLEQGMFNYQYYNMLAKYYYIEAHESEVNGEERYVKSFMDEAYECYKLKDKATLKILQIINYNSVEAYYIEMESESLNGKLFEIRIIDYDRAVFHSKNYKIKDLLKENKIFKDKPQKSIIDAYVNERY